MSHGRESCSSQAIRCAGWTAYDADRFAMSRHYYQETLLLARMNDDRPLEARVLSYMCLQAQRRGRPREAIGLAETALRVSSGWATPRLDALLHLRSARAHAGTQDAAGSGVSLPAPTSASKASSCS